MSNELRIVQLREVCSQIRGVSYNPSDLATELTTQCVTLLRANNIQDRIIFDDVQYVNRSKVSEKQYIKKGDILICASSGSKNLVGKAVQANENYDACFGAFCKVVRPKNIDIRYLGCYFKSDTYRSEISRKSRGANINNIKNEDIDSLVIPLPSLERQREIAAVLDKASELIEKRKEQLRELDTLAESVFYDLFGDPVTNPKGWKTCKVIEQATCIVPGRDKPKSFTGDIPWITTADLQHLSYTHKANLFLSREEISNVKAKVIPTGSVIMTCVGDLGIISITGNEMVINQQLHAFICGDKISNMFLAYNLSCRKDYMYKMASSTTVPYMNKTICNNIPIMLPTIELQNQFAEIIEKIEEQKAKVKEALKESEGLFQRLMQDMFNPQHQQK